MSLQLKETNRLDFCEPTRIYESYETWDEFKEFYGNGSLDTLNSEEHLLFRFDIREQRNPWTEESEGYELWLLYMNQRLGEYQPCIVEQITEADLPEVERYLQTCWEELKVLWREVVS